MNSTADQPNTRESFDAYVSERATKARYHARKNDAAAMACFLMALLGSFAATLCAALSDLPRFAIALLTAVPGTALLANSVFAFDRKCRWHRRRKARYDSVLVRMRFENGDVAVLSKELREFEEKAEKEYPRFGPMMLGKGGESQTA